MSYFCLVKVLYNKQDYDLFVWFSETGLILFRCLFRPAWVLFNSVGTWFKLGKECFPIKLSRGEICVANFIPTPANGASLGRFFCVKNN